jgi:hypothetical protein
MSAPTSEAEALGIESRDPGSEEETMSTTHPLFVAAETDYRLAQARNMYGARPRGRRHHVPRWPSLHLPRRPRRPLSLA